MPEAAVHGLTSELCNGAQNVLEEGMRLLAEPAE